VLTHARSGAAPFAACAQLFACFPLAVAPSLAPAGAQSMILAGGDAGPDDFHVLSRAGDDLFILRSWDDGDGLREEIRPGAPVPGVARDIVATCVPVPRDGALLGWLTDWRVTTLLAVRSGRTESADGPAPRPEILVLPMAGTCVLPEWPPFAAHPLGDWRLWESLDLGTVLDVAPLAAADPGHVFWVPYLVRRAGHRETGCVVVTGNLTDDEHWLPAGVYLDHWRLREGLPAPPADWLLSLPGVTDLAAVSR